MIIPAEPAWSPYPHGKPRARHAIIVYGDSFAEDSPGWRKLRVRALLNQDCDLGDENP